MDAKWVLGLSSLGLMMGLVTSLVGLPQSVEPLVWITGYIVWGVLISRKRIAPFLTPLVASVLAGFWCGLVQMALWPSYVASNPWYADQLAGTGRSPMSIVFGMGMGLIFGLLTGGACWGWRRWRGSSAGGRGTSVG